MAGLKITVGGAEEFAAWAVGKNARLAARIRETLDDVGQEVADEMRSRAPVDTGALRGSIKHEVFGFAVRVGPKVKPQGDRPYAPYVEFGTARMAAQPFVYPVVPVAETMLARGMARVMEED